MEFGYILVWYWDSGIDVISEFGKGNKNGKLLSDKFGGNNKLLVTWDRFSWGLFGMGDHG